MKNIFLLILTATFFSLGCTDKPKPKEKATAATYVLKETLVTGTNNGLISLSGFKRSFAETLCQRWELDKTDDASDELVWDKKTGDRLFPGLALFRDSTAVENPRGKMLIGKWQVTEKDKVLLLTLTFPGQKQHIYTLGRLSSHYLYLAFKNDKGEPLKLTLTSDALVHQDMHNDPFYYTNNLWRIKPTATETDSAIHARTKACIKFYALHFRDFIKRKHATISFSGLPEIFIWYNRAIGLPDREKISQSWINCFYNKAQAEKAYNLLRSLIVNYEFDWPTGTPGWEYQTHSVLEQMYHKF
ncbi:MAG: hypothetical protein QM731_25525 [Chitinophagaceae bacterium]